MVSSEDRKPANLLSELRQKERIVFDRTVVVQIATDEGGYLVLTGRAFAAAPLL